MNEERNPLQQLSLPVSCRLCKNNAYWTLNAMPLCYLHLREVAGMNSDNEVAVHHALISPELVSVSINEVVLRTYPTTCIAPICSVLNNFLTTLPDVDPEAEVFIELWQNQPSSDGVALILQGIGYYSIDSTTIHCNAPLIKLSRPPVGRMCGFMKILNDYSMRIRECVGQEFKEEEVSNG